MLADIDMNILSTCIIHAIEQTVSGLRPEIPYEARLITLGPYSIYLIHKNSSTRISMNTQTNKLHNKTNSRRR